MSDFSSENEYINKYLELNKCHRHLRECRIQPVLCFFFMQTCSAATGLDLSGPIFMGLTIIVGAQEVQIKVHRIRLLVEKKLRGAEK